MRRRVVITGMGAITPLGHTVDAMWKALLEGRSGAGPTTAFNASRFPTKFAAQVKHFDLRQHVTESQHYAHSGPNSCFAAAAAQQALAAAGLLGDSHIDRRR